MTELSVIQEQMIVDLFEKTGAPAHELDADTTAVLLGDLLGRIESEPARVVTDKEGYVVQINPAFSQLCGFTFEEICGRKPGSLLQGPKTSPESIQVLRQGIRSRMPCEVEMVNYHKDTKPYRVHIELKPLSDSKGNHTGFLATERKLP
jgi:PAS domain S-box-containing protein